MCKPTSDDLLDSALLAAHEIGDKPELARLYTEAANRTEARGDVDAACFLLTQAYVFALDAGDPLARGLHARLVAYGRED